MEYIHKVQYYETDKMGIVHHSNYIRWFEEARTAFLERIGLPYDKMEEEGIISPVVEVGCKYISPARFGDTVKVKITLTELGNVRFEFKYIVEDEKTGKERVLGSSKHCFTDVFGKVISLKRERPEMFEKLNNC